MSERLRYHFNKKKINKLSKRKKEKKQIYNSKKDEES